MLNGLRKYLGTISRVARGGFYKVDGQSEPASGDRPSTPDSSFDSYSSRLQIYIK